MSFVIRIVGLANGAPTRYTGLYLRSYDASWVNPACGYDGGLLETTAGIAQAQRFADVGAAMAKWQEQAPPPYHLRWDGKFNRPLTAFTVEVLKV